MRRQIVLSSVIWLAVFAGVAQAADVRINVNIGAPPPPIIVRSAPTMVFLPEPALYVAVGIPYDLYFVGGRYYHYHRNSWYWAAGYGGPWTPVVYSSVPYGLRKYKPARLHEFREREYRVYRVSRPDHARYFVADYGPSGKSRGNGRGNGHKKH
jgi:hypothetical protein